MAAIAVVAYLAKVVRSCAVSHCLHIIAIGTTNLKFIVVIGDARAEFLPILVMPCACARGAWACDVRAVLLLPSFTDGVSSVVGLFMEKNEEPPVAEFPSVGSVHVSMVAIGGVDMWLCSGGGRVVVAVGSSSLVGEV